MKLFYFLFALFFIYSVSKAGDKPAKNAKPGYTIKVKLTGIHDTLAYLGNHFGDKQYVTDTARVDSKGNVTFSGSKTLDGGIYLIITHQKKYFEILLDGKEDNFSIETDTIDFVGNLKVKGSTENQYFNDYQKFLTAKAKESEPIRKLFEKAKTDKKDTKEFQDKLTAIDKEVKDYKVNFMSAHPESFLSKIIRATQPPEIPEIPTLPSGRKDSTFSYRYYKAHFWDNIDFNDARLLRTPILQGKLKEYFEQMTYQIPDSIIIECDKLIEKSRKNKEMFKYLVVYFTSNYERSNIMGMDAVFVHLGKKYYTYDQAYWVDSTTVFKIQDRAKRTEPLLVGKKTPWFACQDTAGQWIDIYRSVNAEYTVLIFWDPDCGHCKKAMPSVIEAYDKLKQYNVQFVGVCTEVEKDKWLKYIREQKLKWINVADPDIKSNFRYDYYIESTPQVYVLDKNKKIIAKKLAAEQLYDFFSRNLKVAPIIEDSNKDKDKKTEKATH